MFGCNKKAMLCCLATLYYGSTRHRNTDMFIFKLMNEIYGNV
jgi:hypothetical protein